jgi:hypothetical protein
MATRCGRVHADHPRQREALLVDRSTAFAPVTERSEFSPELSKVILSLPGCATTPIPP